MKKLICILVVCVMISISLPAMAADCIITADETAATDSGAAVVTLKIENNPGMALGKVRISFDNTKLIPVSVSRGELLTNAYSFTSNIDDESIDAAELDYVTVSWMNMANIIGDGNIASVEFAVVGNPTEDAVIDVEVSELANMMSEDITASAKDGKVTFGNGGDGNDNGGIEVGISSTTLAKNDTGIGGSMNLSVYSSEATSAAFIFSIFDGAGTLAAVALKDNVALKAGINEVPLGEIRANVPAGTACAVKVYMWNSVRGMVPLTDEPITQVYR